MTDNYSDWGKGRTTDSEILFSRAVKAGKRIYYIDVKQDRKGGYYISVTESKRLKEAADDGRPTFEKHKIFLYREDLEKFHAAFTAATDFVYDRTHGMDYAPDWAVPEDDDESTDDYSAYGGEPQKSDLDF